MSVEKKEHGMPETDVAVVLAHGGWADGSSWNKVTAGLRSEGVRAVAAPLPMTTLADDVAMLDHVLERLAGPVVVAAHAYAGAVIGSTINERVASLVYVTALAPDEGETVADVYYWAEHHVLAPDFGPDRHGLIWLPEDAFAQAFAQHASPLEHALLAATQRPLAAACIGVPVDRPLWKDRPSWFLVAEEDRMIPSKTQRFMAERMKARVHTVPCDHVPMITKASAVVDVLMEAVRDAAKLR
jgi:pimeloyl-ACP methyl ester carboxylesterase